jgi:histidine kinase
MSGRSRFLGSMGSRLLASYLGVIVVAIVVLFVTVRATSPSLFDHHIGDMAAMHDQSGSPMAAEAQQIDDAMARSLNEGFLIAAAVALPLGLVASILIARQVARSVGRLAGASQHIASGDYAQRVPVDGPAELEELARSFNAMATALEETEKRRVEFIGDVSHELRTPVAVLRGYVEGLADGVFPASDETWAKLSAETLRLGSLVEDLQELSRAQAGQLPVSISSVSAGDGVRIAAERFEAAFQEKGLRLELAVPGDLPRVLADPDRLVQLLSGLLSNALRYTPAGSVSVTARADGVRVAVSVRDTGIGITPEQLPHVFERFFRADSSRARASGGSGVGLTIALALATAMGGSLRAQSGGVGQGSTFTLELPIAG